MKDVVLITNYWHFSVEKKSARYLYLADLLSNNDINLEVITSSFYHATKKQRNYDEDFLNSFKYKVSLIREPGYKKNISFRRLYSHKCFGKNVLNYMKSRDKPDLIYLVVPSLDVGDYISKFANENRIPLVIDIQDLWPEAFKMAINIPILSDIIFQPMKIKVNKIYSRADKIIAVSDTYVNRALSVNKKDKNGLSVYIGTDLQYAKRCIDENKIIRHDNEFWIMYVGTLSYSYDIKLIIDAIYELNKQGINNIVFKVMGSGPKENEFKNYAKEKKIKADFFGNLDYSLMMGILASGDIAVNPIVSTSVSSIINKVGDYAAVGIPVLNTQNSSEYIQILQKYDAGISCGNNVKEVMDCIRVFFYNQELRKIMKKNSKIMATELFDRNRTYLRILELINNLKL